MNSTRPCMPFMLPIMVVGRRPKIKVNFNRHFVLQLHSLYHRSEKPWYCIEDLLMIAYPAFPYAPSHLRAIVDRCLKDVDKFDHSVTISSFLNEAIELDSAEPILYNIGLKRSELLGSFEDLQTKIQSMHPVLNKGMIVEIERLRKMENLNINFTCGFVIAADATLAGLEKHTKKQVSLVMKDHERKVKSGNRRNDNGDRPIDVFRQEILIVDGVSSSVVSQIGDNSTQEVEGIVCEHVELGASVNVLDSTEPVLTKFVDEKIRLKLSENSIKLLQLRQFLEEADKNKDIISMQLSVTKDYCSELKTKVASSESNCLEKNRQVQELLQNVKELQDDVKFYKGELKKSQDETTSIKNSNYYRRNHRWDEELQQREETLRLHVDGGCVEKIQALQKQVKNLQSVVSQKKDVIEKCRLQNSSMKEKINKLKEDLVHIDFSNTKFDFATIIMKEGNKFTNDVVKCVVQLIGEVGVAAGRCSQCIKCVCKCIFHVDIDDKYLPSDRSNLRFADQGNVLCQVHLAEVILKSDGFDLHTDGTGRDKRQYIGHQATMSTGQVMSMGYNLVSTEDTETLLDVATSILMELSDVYSSASDKDRDDTFKDILRKLIGLMSDRASVMKSFNKAMNEKRIEVLGQDAIQLQYLYCSAHFLLGLSSEAEKGPKELQKPLGKLGRDIHACFKSFNQAEESAVSRLIRTGCDVLGPRGDEKNGCRDAWEAYCILKDISSHIQSFRGNRFNNFFEAASALAFHRNSIIDFFSNYRERPNLKLQSVLADCESDAIIDLLIAVGIMYHVVTGPYWMLVTSDVEYLDLYKYIVPMHEKFFQLSTDASSLLDGPLDSIIPDFSLRDHREDERAQLKVVKDKAFIQKVLQRLFGGFLAVTERQFVDFLPGGKFHNVQDEELRNRMSHSQLTNLTGEANLADLDFSIFTKRNPFLHHRSFCNMMKRNKPITTWLEKKSQKEQSDLLSMSAKKSKPLREKHKQNEMDVKKKTRERILTIERKLEEKRQNLMQRKAELSRHVKSHGGPCLYPKYVDVLVGKFSSSTAKKKELNFEVQYQKTVIGAQSKLLTSSKLTWEVIYKNLKRFLQGMEKEKDECDSEAEQPGPDHIEETAYDHDTSVEDDESRFTSESDTDIEESRKGKSLN